MKVPFIDLNRKETGFNHDWYTHVQRISEKSQFIGGIEVSNLENNLKKATGTSHVITCANGTDALQLALRAIDVGPGDIVFIPDLTFWATFEAVVNVGAKPFLLDCSLHDLNLDSDQVYE